MREQHYTQAVHLAHNVFKKGQTPARTAIILVNAGAYLPAILSPGTGVPGPVLLWMWCLFV